ncbi:MAG: IS30 family transposase [Clostridiales bacterium]|nr:IS30 family transposase [Clostridiales bacterium]
MLETTNKKGKHLTDHDRTFIEDGLKYGHSLKDISAYLMKDPTTISKEIKRNRILKENKHEFKGGCTNRKACQKMHICNDDCDRLCKKCTTLNCFRHCFDFKVKICQRVKGFPHVCNGCESKITCKLNKYRYSAKHASANYREKLETSRQGIKIAKSELEALDELVSPLILKGQPIAHIYANHKDEMNCSEHTLYNYIDLSLLAVRNIDLRRKVKYKPRKKKKTTKEKKTHRINKSYTDFLAYMALNPDTNVVEMDTVIGRKGGKVLLTLFFRNSSLMVAILLNSVTQACVRDAINKIYDDVGLETFKSSFDILLTDNGSEFLDSDIIERDLNGNQRTQVFYCDPMASHQKGQLEKNHEFIRYVLPKGQSFDHLNQEKITLLMNHINSVSRKGLDNNTPFKLALPILDNKLLDALSFKEIHPDDVHLKEELLEPNRLKRTLLEGLI